MRFPEYREVLVICFFDDFMVIAVGRPTTSSVFGSLRSNLTKICFKNLFPQGVALG